MSASAKPLFRAISGQVAPGRAVALPHLDAPEVERPEGDLRRALDFYPTHQPEPVRALLAADGARIRALGSVWENSVGDGAIARELAAAGLPVIGSDIVDRGWPGTVVASFYDYDTAPAPAIVGNPPYDQINARDGAGRWLRHTLDMPGWRYCAYLLSWDWPAAVKNGLGALLDERPFTCCYLLRWKVDFTGQGSPPQRNAWFVWDRDDPRSRPGLGPHPEPAFRWMDRGEDGRQPGLFGAEGAA